MLDDVHHFFARNEINRFSLGTKSKDRVDGSDGSLTIYVQHKQPDNDKVANWLARRPRASLSCSSGRTHRRPRSWTTSGRRLL